MLRLFFTILASLFMIHADAQQWALVNIPVANVRSTPGNSQELASQELMGMPVMLQKERNGWWLVETADGYSGWMRGESMAILSPEEMESWRSSPRLVVSSLGQITCYDSPKAISPRHVVTDLVPNSIVEGQLKDLENGRAEIALPDGRTAWAEASALVPIEEWASQPFDSGKIIDQAYALMGTPYLWGGASVKALDCSGLTKTCYLKNGRFIRRDASMQAADGLKLGNAPWQDLEAADLVFFGSKSTGRVTHVGLHVADGIFVHSTGTGDRVRLGSLNPDSSLYMPLHRLGSVRVKDMEGTSGIILAINHPWLFNN